MKVEKFKVLLYLKKSEPDKTGKAPIMGRITLNRTMAQFSCKLSCTPGLWNARESRLNGKSREAVETNEKIERLLLAVHSAFNSLMERKRDFDAAVELPEDKVRNLEFRLDEFGKRAVGEEVGRECGGRTVHTDTGLHFPVMPVEKFEQGHLHARIALEHVPDRSA